MANLAKAKYASKCVECGLDLKPGAPIWWEGQAAWCQTHGEYPHGEPETAVPAPFNVQGIVDSLDALSNGVSDDLAVIGALMRELSRKLDTLIEQGKK